MPLGPLMVDIDGQELTVEDREVLSSPLVGGLILFTRNYSEPGQLAELVASIRALPGPDLLIAVDQEGGRVQRFRKGFTRLPPMQRCGQEYVQDAATGREFARRAGWLMAAEVMQAGVDLSFAPVVDIDYGLSTVIGDRAFHTDREVIAQLALAFMQGMRQAGMAAVAKHFPGHGGVRGDTHTEICQDDRPYSSLQDDMQPYGPLMRDGLAGVMLAHVLYPAIDSLPASMSAHWIQRELRERLGFTGAIFSDDMSMDGASGFGSIPERVRRSLLAGADMALICNDRAATLATLDAMRDWELDPASGVRLAAMRADPARLGLSVHGTPEWEHAVAALTAEPEFELRG